MGTPAFAVPSLCALLEAPGSYLVAGVVTQPDAPAGRGRATALSPVKQRAVQHGLAVLQPERVRRPEAVAALQALAPDVQIVAAFGQILPRSVLDIPRLGTLNVHASLLPRWRGAAPIPAAILAGDEQTGVTIMRLDEGMDTGDILAQSPTPIAPGDTTGSLTARLADLGAALLLDTLPRWASGDIAPRPQDNALATTCKPVRKESGRLDWRRPARDLARAVRAYAPWPGSFTSWEGRMLKITAAHALPGDAAGRLPATVISAGVAVAVVTGEGLLALDELQLEGRRALPADDFVRGQRAFIGAVLE
jgi:methionyl-tRNA formyltransferase